MDQKWIRNGLAAFIQHEIMKIENFYSTMVERENKRKTRKNMHI